MLVLSRKLRETVLIGDSIEVQVTRITSTVVRLSVKAPASVRIVRGELADRNGKEAA